MEFLLKLHKEKGGFATLLLTDFKPSNLVMVEEDMVTGFSRERRHGCFCFTGISVIEPRFHTYCPAPMPFSLIDIFKTALLAGETIYGLMGEETHPGFFWYDIGTPEGYIKAHEQLLTGLSGESWNWIGKGAVIPQGSSLNRSIVWDNTVVPQGGPYERTVFTPFGILKAS